MTPEEKELILNLAYQLKNTPAVEKEYEAEALIRSEILSQPDHVYKLVQMVLVQEMALKANAQQIAYLQENSAYYQNESQRSPFSKMFGGSTPPPPMPPQPEQPSAFGSFMQTAAGVAAGMVAGHLLTEALFGEDDPLTAAADAATEAAAAVADPIAAVEEVAQESAADFGFDMGDEEEDV